MTISVERHGGSTPHLDLFGMPEFVELQQRSGHRVFHFQVCRDQVPMGAIVFIQRDERLFASPGRGSYGGILGQDLSATEYHQAYHQILDCLPKPASFRVRLFPSVYAPSSFALQYNALTRLGFSITSADVNYAIEVKSDPLAQQMSQSKRKRLRRLQNDESLRVSCSQSDSKNQEIYDVICQNRQSRGYPVTLTWQQLSDLFQGLSNLVRFLVCG